MEMSRRTRDETSEPASRDQIIRHGRRQGNIYFSCSADHKQDCQLYPVDPYSTICDDYTYILGRVVAASARGNLPSLLERLPERPMASALIEELKIVATEAKRSQIEDAVGSSWAALAAEEDPQGRGIGALLVEAGAEGRGGGGGGGGEERGGEGGSWGRGCWTARTMGGSVGNPA